MTRISTSAHGLKPQAAGKLIDQKWVSDNFAGGKVNSRCIHRPMRHESMGWLMADRLQPASQLPLDP